MHFSQVILAQYRIIKNTFSWNLEWIIRLWMKTRRIEAHGQDNLSYLAFAARVLTLINNHDLYFRDKDKFP